LKSKWVAEIEMLKDAVGAEEKLNGGEGGRFSQCMEEEN
jgi:hypothetical protein